MTKYRLGVLQGVMRERLRKIIGQTCSELDAIIVARGASEGSYAHVFVGPAKLSLAFVIQRITGRSSRRIRLELRELRKRHWGRRFWARGFFSTTSGNATDDLILNYLEFHSKLDATGGNW